MKHILALDLGTTNVRAVLFDEAMRPVSTDEMEDDNKLLRGDGDDTNNELGDDEQSL